MPEPRWDFFVSFTGADRYWAGWIYQQLEAAGYRVVYQESHFVPGTNWSAFMVEAMRDSARTVAVLSPAYLKSAFAAAEWREAWRSDPSGAGRRLVPVRVEDFDPDEAIGQIVYIDLVGLPEDDARDRLLNGVTAALHGEATPPPRAFPGRPRPAPDPRPGSPRSRRSPRATSNARTNSPGSATSCCGAARRA